MSLLCTLKKKLFLVRHGMVYNPQRIMYRRLPGFGLSSKGRQEAKHAAGFLLEEPIEVIYYSPLKRTEQTAKILSQFHNAVLIANSLLNEWGELETSEQVLEDVWKVSPDL
jgi:broad specificity phosphatase PhoE